MGIFKKSNTILCGKAGKMLILQLLQPASFSKCSCRNIMFFTFGFSYLFSNIFLFSNYKIKERTVYRPFLNLITFYYYSLSSCSFLPILRMASESSGPRNTSRFFCILSHSAAAVSTTSFPLSVRA